MFLIRIAMLVILTVSVSAFAQNNEGAFLDPAYTTHIHPKKKISIKDTLGNKGVNVVAAKSNTAATIAKQSAVKSQGARGTCSIFSATAMLEAMLIKRFNAPLSTDLSEEWLEYIIMKQTASEGSSSTANYRAFTQFGSANEQDLPYIGETWDSIVSGTLSETQCGAIDENDSYRLKSCLLGHRDPDLVDLSDAQLGKADSDLLVARQHAFDLRDKYIKPSTSSFTVYNVQDIKALLAKGIPVTVDLDFYYGTWNHREAVDLGIPRDLDSWAKGIVGYPLAGSVDEINTHQSPAGHSVLLVGYDDTKVIELKHLMPDGTTVTKQYQGVYYFKNSWGTANFGVDFKLDGVSYPGYGMMTQDYAHDYGTFYQLPL